MTYAPLMFVELGNSHPAAVAQPSVTEWKLPGAKPEDAGWTLDECLVSVQADWAIHGTGHPPTWVKADNPELEAALAAAFGCPVGYPDDLHDAYLTRSNGGT